MNGCACCKGVGGSLAELGGRTPLVETVEGNAGRRREVGENRW